MSEANRASLSPHPPSPTLTGRRPAYMVTPLVPMLTASAYISVRHRRMYPPGAGGTGDLPWNAGSGPPAEPTCPIGRYMIRSISSTKVPDRGARRATWRPRNDTRKRETPETKSRRPPPFGRRRDVMFEHPDTVWAVAMLQHDRLVGRAQRRARLDRHASGRGDRVPAWLRSLVVRCRSCGRREQPVLPPPRGAGTRDPSSRCGTDGRRRRCASGALGATRRCPTTGRLGAGRRVSSAPDQSSLHDRWHHGERAER